MNSTKKRLAAERKAAAAAVAAKEFAKGARHVPILALAWVGLLAATAIAILCPRFTVYYAVYLAVVLGLGAGALAFLDAIYRKRKAALHPAFKKFLGYGLVLHYAAAALPRVDWSNAGLIGQGRVAYMFVLAMACLALGFALFIACGRPSAYAALGLLTAEEARDRELRKKRLAADRKKGFVHAALEWVDALGFAAILVILINTFVFQLYEIPTESMVPTFLKKDRPFTVKFLAGPRVPLTDWRLPFLKLPARGDVITLANPRYKENQGVNLKKYLSQLVSMVTFTAVNIDRYLPNGQEKADPLVKRVVGLPGERLMMVDDVLYSMRGGDASFSPVAKDATWARVDLWKESPQYAGRIDYVPMDEKHRAMLSAWDARRRDADPAALAASISAKAATLAAPAAEARVESLLAELKKTRPTAYAAVAAYLAKLDGYAEGGADPISAAGTGIDASGALALALGRSAAARAAVADYARSAAAAARSPAASAYERGGRVLNLLVKESVLARAARYSALVSSGAGLDAIVSDAEASRLEGQASELDYYVNGRNGGLYDARNFAPFPAGGYLGPTQYFAMGDNRYNSIDFRMKEYDYSMRPLDPADSSSVEYLSNIDPFALDLEYIEGYALFRIWPPSRMGSLK
jgi:signal peptidase I